MTLVIERTKNRSQRVMVLEIITLQKFEEELLRTYCHNEDVVPD